MGGRKDKVEAGAVKGLVSVDLACSPSQSLLEGPNAGSLLEPITAE